MSIRDYRLKNSLINVHYSEFVLKIRSTRAKEIRGRQRLKSHASVDSFVILGHGQAKRKATGLCAPSPSTHTPNTLRALRCNPLPACACLSHPCKTVVHSCHSWFCTFSAPAIHRKMFQSSLYLRSKKNMRYAACPVGQKIVD